MGSVSLLYDPDEYVGEVLAFGATIRLSVGGEAG